MTALTFRGPRFATPFGTFRLADALVRGTVSTRPAESAWYVPAADVERDGDDAVVRLELPGVDVASDVTVEVTGHRLVVAGERRDERTGEGFRESRRGSFRRSFSLPRHVGPDAVSASYEAGVLTVRVSGAHTEPRPVTPETRRIAIDGVTPVEPRGSAADEAPAEDGGQAQA